MAIPQPPSTDSIPVAHALGRRGVVLILLGVMEIFRGVTVWSGIRWEDDYAPVFNAIPLPLRSGLWIAFGVVGIICALSPRRLDWQAAGFAVLVLMPIERAAGHLWAWMAWLIPGSPGGDGYGWAWAGWWLCGSAVIWVMSQWDEDIPRLRGQ